MTISLLNRSATVSKPKHYRTFNINANVMLETTFFSTVQIKDVIKVAYKSLSHDLHNAIGHLGVSPAAWSS